MCALGSQATSWIRGNKIMINKAKLVEGAYAYKNIPRQVIGKTSNGLLIKTGNTMLEITECTYSGKVSIGNRLKDYE